MRQARGAQFLKVRLVREKYPGGAAISSTNRISTSLAEQGRFQGRKRSIRRGSNDEYTLSVCGIVKRLIFQEWIIHIGVR